MQHASAMKVNIVSISWFPSEEVRFQKATMHRKTLNGDILEK